MNHLNLNQEDACTIRRISLRDGFMELAMNLQEFILFNLAGQIIGYVSNHHNLVLMVNVEGFWRAGSKIRLEPDHLFGCKVVVPDGGMRAKVLERFPDFNFVSIGMESLNFGIGTLSLTEWIDGNLDLEDNNPVVRNITQMAREMKDGEISFPKSASGLAKNIEKVINEYIHSGECHIYYGERTCIVTRIEANHYEIYYDCPTQNWAVDLMSGGASAIFRALACSDDTLAKMRLGKPCKSIHLDCKNGCTLSVYADERMS
jgi:hypothetical protein